MFYSISGLGGGEIFIKSTVWFWLNFYHVLCPRHSSLNHSLTGACLSPHAEFSLIVLNVLRLHTCTNQN